MIVLGQASVNARIASCFIFSMRVHRIKHDVSSPKYVRSLSLKIIYGGCLLVYHHHQSRLLLHDLLVTETQSLIDYLVQSYILSKVLRFFIIVRKLSRRWLRVILYNREYPIILLVDLAGTRYPLVQLGGRVLHSRQLLRLSLDQDWLELLFLRWTQCLCLLWRWLLVYLLVYQLRYIWRHHWRY